MMERVLRGLCKDVLQYTTTRIVDEYLHKRLDPVRLSEQDPLKRVAAEMMDNVMRKSMKGFCREVVNSLAQDYLIEAQFYNFFNNYFIKREI